METILNQVKGYLENKSDFVSATDIAEALKIDRKDAIKALQEMNKMAMLETLEGGGKVQPRYMLTTPIKGFEIKNKLTEKQLEAIEKSMRSGENSLVIAEDTCQQCLDKLKKIQSLTDSNFILSTANELMTSELEKEKSRNDSMLKNVADLLKENEKLKLELGELTIDLKRFKASHSKLRTAAQQQAEVKPHYLLIGPLKQMGIFSDLETAKSEGKKMIEQSGSARIYEVTGALSVEKIVTFKDLNLGD